VALQQIGCESGRVDKMIVHRLDQPTSGKRACRQDDRESLDQPTKLVFISSVVYYCIVF
jgi:hypothetical protein